MKKAVFIGVILLTSLAHAIVLDNPSSIETFLRLNPQANTDMLPFIIANGSPVKSIEITGIKQAYTSSQILCTYTYLVKLQTGKTSFPMTAKKILIADEETRYCPYNP